MPNKSFYNIKNGFILLICLLSASHYAPAKETYKFRTMSPHGGFYFDGVKNIEQSCDGFIWVVMDDELYRFDGFEYKKYYAHFAAIDNTKKWVFLNVISNSRGELFVNTNNGLYAFDRYADRFHRIYDNVTLLRVDKADNLWIWHQGKWGILNTQTAEWHIPLLNGEIPSSINPAFCTYNNDAYLFIRNRIYRYQYTRNELVLCTTLPEEGDFISSVQARQGKLWILTNKHRLYKIELSDFSMEDHYDFIINEDNAFRAFYVDKKNNIWFGTINGLYILDPETHERTYYTHDENNPFSLPSNSIWTIKEDRQQNVWIGMYSGAMCYVNIDENNAFESYSPQNSALSLSPVSAFAEDNQYLWVGTEGGGINLINKETGVFEQIIASQNIHSNNIKSLAADNRQNIWVGTFRGGLSRIGSRTHDEMQIMRFYKQTPNDSNSLIVNDIRKIIPERDSGLWIAYQYRKTTLSYLSLKDNRFTHIQLDNEQPDEYIFDILKQNEDYLWAITSNHLYRLNTKTHAVEKITPSDSVYTSLFTFCLDASGEMWIGTIGNGLIRFNPDTHEQVSLHTLLPNAIYSIYSICYDDGVIWMGTNDGMYCYHIAQNSLQKFDEGEGTQGQVYYPLALMRGKNGKLYFGGTNGFTMVDPTQIGRNEHKPQVIISDFLIDYVSAGMVPPDSRNKNEIVLNYKQANFGFRFSSDNYLIPEKNRFKYRLKGYEDRWIETDAYNRTALYSKVPPGIYYFEINTANNDYVWSDTPTVIKIIRKPAPWFSIPAYILYTFIFLLIILLIIRHYRTKKKLEIQLYLDHVEKKKQEELHQSQLRFFTNISHDFRTPLSLIIASLDKLRQEGLKEYYYRILSSNAKRLLNLVNELMDFRTVENGKMTLSLQPVNINQYIQELGRDFTDYARQKKIDFRITGDPNLPETLYADKKILEKVVMNLLNNAFKYTPEGRTISLETFATPFISAYKNHFEVKGECIPKSVFCITIRDSGTGISEESIPYVFERFYKANTEHSDPNLSTGIGLALVKSLVLLHRGIIHVYSEKGKGTDITVCLSAKHTIYDKDSFIKRPGQEEIPAGDDSQKAATQDPNDLLEDDIKQIQQKSKKRILIAEDNEDLRHIISDYLSDEYDVIQAKDGVDASELLSKKVVDLIISDIMMPRKDGIAFNKEVKENIETSHIPFLLLTAKTSLESKLEGADSGADIYFEKPIDLQLLKRSIQNVFKHRQQLKEYYARNHYADSAELSSNERDARFLQDFIHIIEKNLDHPEMDVNSIAAQLSMSRSKLYRKIKSMTDKSIVEFILSYKMKKAARLIIEKDMTMREIMDRIGIESQPYFTNAFKKEFGETPSAFAAKHKYKQHPEHPDK